MSDRQFMIDSLNYYESGWHKDEYETKWKNIREKYKAIHLFPFRAEAIGECIPAFCHFYLHNIVNENELNVYIPDTSKAEFKLNGALFDLFRNYLYIIKPEEADFWKYVVRKHFDELDVFDVYNQRASYKRMPRVMKKMGEPIIPLSESIQEYGEKLSKSLGLKKDFVCFAARSASYNLCIYGTDFDYSHRNMDFYDYKKGIDYLDNEGLASVRMGRFETKLDDIKPCIDYAGCAACDEMDLYLAANCKFLVSNSTGLQFLASLFGRPDLVVNLVPATMGAGGLPGTWADMYMPCKYYSHEKGRNLTLREMAYADANCQIWEERYKKAGIEFIKNTPEEIAMAVEEMNAKLNGTWVVSEDEKSCMEKYEKVAEDVYNISMANQRSWNGCPFGTHIIYSYLKNNMYLLD